MNNNNEEGITLLQIFKVMLGRKLLLLIITLAITIVGTLAIVLGYNNLTQTYTTTFGYSNPNLFDDKYVDGSSFNYQTLIDEDTLKDLVKSDSEFKSIDIDQMIDDEGITITVNKTINQTETEIIVSEKDYTITVNSKYFKNKKQAKAFVKAVTELPLKKNDQVIESVKNDNYLTSYASNNDFISKANNLVSQYNYLMSSYKDLISNYDNMLVDGMSLSSYQNNLLAFYNESSLSMLCDEIIANIYVLDYETNKEEFNNQYEYYKNKYDLNVKTINALQEKVDYLLSKSSNVTSLELSDYNSKIAEYTIENIEYQNKMKYYGNALGKYETTDSNYVVKATTEENKAFASKLDNYYNEIKKFTDTYTSVSTSAIKSCDKAYYNSTNIVSINGGISAVLAIAISLVLGLVIACITNLIVDRKKLVAAYNNTPITNNTDTKDNQNEESK